MSRGRRLLGLIMAILLCLSIFPIQAYAREKTSVVRVGYIDYQGFIEQDSDGTYFGYGVSYLNEIANYTGWTYDYHFDSWSNCLEMLRNGQIDMICTAQKTPEREAVYDFADYSLGYEAGIVYTRDDNESINYEDYLAMNAKRIGLLERSFQAEEFEEYARENNFTYEPYYYSNDSEMAAALEDGTVEMIVTGSLALHKDFKTVAKFGSQPYFPMVTKGNEEVLGGLNEALSQIKTMNPYFEAELYEQYYGVSASVTEPLLTREDVQYIQSSKPLTVGLWSEDYPYSSMDSEGNLTGIDVELLQLIAKKSGLQFDIQIDDENSMLVDSLKAGQFQLIAGEMRAEKYLEDATLQVSSAYLNSKLETLVQTGFEFDSKEQLRIAIPDYCSYLEAGLKNDYKGCEIVYEEDTRSCMNLVAAGEADMMLDDEHIVNYYLQNPHYAQLTIATNYVIAEPLCIMANTENTDPRLISILNKTIASLQSSQVDEIVTKYTISKPYKNTIGDILYEYRYSMAIIASLLVILIVLICIFNKRKVSNLIAQKEAQTLRFKAERDSLTGIYNKDKFYDSVRKRLMEHPEKKFEIIAIDIERFKIINDLYGMEEGDKLLVYIGQMLLRTARERGGIAGRIGADNFVACVETMDQSAIRLFESVQREVWDYPLETNIELRCGVYEVDDYTIPVNIMCDYANLAAEQIKGSYLEHLAFYSDEHREQMIQEQEILNDMHDALRTKQFEVYIQPKCDTVTGEIIGGEALARWNHPTKGMLSPGLFIPIFEKNGFVMQLDEHIWEQTCRILKGWKERGIPLVPISVNLSRVNLYNENLAAYLKALIQLYEVDAKYLQLEVTESAYTEDRRHLYEVLEELQANGFRILMDDFGSGYSSLSMLKEAPVDILKMDMFFCMGEDKKRRGGIILTAIIKMAKSLGFEVTAEGVETKEQLEVLKKLGCDNVQGYYFYRPMPAEAFEELMKMQ